MGTAWLLSRLRRTKRKADQATDDLTAELTANYWRVYDQRMATVKFSDVARTFPGLVGQAIRLGWSASRADISTTIWLNLIAGFFSGYALFETTGVLQALFAAGPGGQYAELYTLQASQYEE